MDKRPDKHACPPRGAGRGRGELFRFVIVGAASAVAYALIAAAVTGMTPVPDYLSGLILFGLFIPVTFLAHKRFTFRSDRLNRSAFSGYALLQLACYAFVSGGSTQLLTGDYGRDAVLYFATVGAAAAASFLIGKLVIFRPAPEAAPRNEASGRRPR